MKTSLDFSLDSSLIRWFRSKSPRVVQAIAQTPGLGERLSFIVDPKCVRGLKIRNDTLVLEMSDPLAATECWQRYLSVRPQDIPHIAILSLCAGDPYLYKTNHPYLHKLEDWQ